MEPTMARDSANGKKNGKNGKNARPYIGIDLGGTNVTLGLVDTDTAKVLERHKVKTKPLEGAERVLQRIVQATRALLDKAGLAGVERIGGVGIGAPGTVNVATGVVRNAVNLCWEEYPLGRKLGEALKTPVVVDNDVTVGAWGEHVAGAGRGHGDMLAVFVGTGIGAGLVLNGRLYRGHFQTAGEIGQTVLMPHGSLGRRTLENHASRTAVVNIIRDLIRSNHQSSITKVVGGDLDKIRSKVLADAIAQGDPLTCRVVEQSAYYVGMAIANTVTILSLPCVVLGGGLAEALGERYLKMVRAAFEQLVHPPELKACKLLLSKLGDDSGIVGAALLARDPLAAAHSAG
jgi:glucokinase